MMPERPSIPQLTPLDALLVVPPLAHLTWPSLAVHQLQACARDAGHAVSVLYGTTVLAQAIGCLPYAALCNAPVHWLLGERLFARAAWGKPALGDGVADLLLNVNEWHVANVRPAGQYMDHLSDSSRVLQGGALTLSAGDLVAAEQAAFDAVQVIAERILDQGPRIVGATTTFDQTAAAIAILAAVKRLDPKVITVLGGANCDGPMGAGLAAATDVDAVFSGESEATFVAFLSDPSARGVVNGEPCTEMDALPAPDFTAFFAQVPPQLADTPLWILYETSRGCWWGQKRHCTFCGLNAQGMAFRQRSADRVIGQLNQMLRSAPTRRVCLTDNIMPHDYHRTLMPRLASEVPELTLFYEQKANLNLRQVGQLHDAGCRALQPGIEALDTPLLKRMKKGVLARQNVALLRYAHVVGVHLKWNLLWGFPGDDLDSYRRTLALLPLLRHLPPPQAFAHLHLDRFSPYFDHPEQYGVSNLRPLPGYADVFPSAVDPASVAYHFTGDYPSGAHDDEVLVQELVDVVQEWKQAWETRRCVLTVRSVGPSWLLTDTRPIGRNPMLYLNDAQARAVLVGGPRGRVGAADWAIRNRLAVDLDGWCVPLATTERSTLASLESEGADGDVAVEVLSLSR